MQSTHATGSTRLSLRGELDLASVETVQARVDALVAAGETVRIDVSELGFIDSTGIALLINLVQAGREDHCGVGVEPSATGQVLRVLELTGADRFLWPPSDV